eukprot:CAMPEP_0113651422 /NCGR_PEP_ID=MMETSP0017_2-20120614/27399_1 /TAXON_ID=2856 /ORGANISM="Cylindrotheca closterium" /LENGTH=50 /DNA_ID=CAMNT_0000564071 /DNA_START=192 /DNA_END=344 /DNA_ORIENTATION=- /assembly_acc=CAM_ASM_000147
MVHVAIRTIGLKYFPVAKDAMDRVILGDYADDDDSDEDAARWPNMTQPQT